MAARNFYHGKDADIVAGAANFASLISAGFASYGLSSAQSTAFGLLNTALQSAYTTATTPSTRSPVAIEAKNLAILNMRRLAVNLARIVSATATVTDAQLVSLGLLPRTVPTPRPVPGTPPMIEFLSCAGRVVTIRIHSATGESRAKPFGAIGADIYSAVSPTVPTDPNAYRHEGLATRGKMRMTFPNDVPSGATIWLSGVWVSARGERSMGSTPISFTLQGGPITAEVA